MGGEQELSEARRIEAEGIRRELDERRVKALERVARTLERIDDAIPEKGLPTFLANTEIALGKIASRSEKLDDLAEEVSQLRLEVGRMTSAVTALAESASNIAETVLRRK
jgi:methyl-accepting chemotaxis protein